ncbi:MAG TPA: acetoacetate--CoA ligase, partial [Vicinamibacterales bacterium]|nr:acetoacetate--CoA ligase [Vicinamibacterales bacterium]
RIERANVTAFAQRIAEAHGSELRDFPRLRAWSAANPDKFWPVVWEFCGVRASRGWDEVLVDGDRMPGARWFTGARLNYAENLLRFRDHDRLAIVAAGEDGRRRRLTYAELHDQVARLAAALRADGVGVGDRVAGLLPNLPETIVAMLATTSIGAIWSSCSPDFGVQGVLDRFGQIEPRVLVAADGYFYGGKQHDVLSRLREVADRLPTVERVVVIPYASERPRLDGIRGALTWDDFVGTDAAGAIPFERLPFNHPLYILYSSGTTGVPKCIVHGAGGTLIQHLKEHQLHCDIQSGDRVFYFTTCGWMMWNWLVSALASGATLLLYDGSPFHPDPNVLFDFADRHSMTLFGTSAKYLDALRKAEVAPIRTHKLLTVRTMTSTGSPLAPESFEYVYRDIKEDIHLASISGGTDIISCFVGGNPLGPVWRGEIQVRALGMRVEVFDEEGRPVRGEKGELVCTMPFPSMPVGFWNDPDGRKYRAAYFERFPNVWHHGDYVELTEHDGMIIYGRSDAVLNPAGVRIGTAEIYRQVEQLDDIVESIVIGQKWDGDERVVLFVRLRDGLTLTPELEDRIRRRIRENTSPRHVPARIVQVGEIPRTKSGKIVELAVRDVVHGREVKNREALANPEALEQFRNRPELAT